MIIRVVLVGKYWIVFNIHDSKVRITFLGLRLLGKQPASYLANTSN